VHAGPPAAILADVDFCSNQTMNSSGFEFPVFERCYRQKATPVRGAYCKAEPGSPQCRRP